MMRKLPLEEEAPHEQYSSEGALFRYHLFVWSVFAPKLLYEVAYSMAQLVAACAICACVPWLRISPIF